MILAIQQKKRHDNLNEIWRLFFHLQCFLATRVMILKTYSHIFMFRRLHAYPSSVSVLLLTPFRSFWFPLHSLRSPEFLRTRSYALTSRWPRDGCWCCRSLVLTESLKNISTTAFNRQPARGCRTRAWVTHATHTHRCQFQVRDPPTLTSVTKTGNPMQVLLRVTHPRSRLMWKGEGGLTVWVSPPTRNVNRIPCFIKTRARFASWFHIRRGGPVI